VAVYPNTITIQRDPTTASGCTTASQVTPPSAQAALNSVNGKVIDPSSSTFPCRPYGGAGEFAGHGLDKNFKF